MLDDLRKLDPKIQYKLTGGGGMGGSVLLSALVDSILDSVLRAVLESRQALVQHVDAYMQDVAAEARQQVSEVVS
jgi:hypothetical protein